MEKNAIVRITDENPAYTSITGTDKKERAKLYNAIENPDGKLSDFINKKLKVSDVYMEKTEIMERDDEGNPTGVLVEVVKTVLITPDGKAYFSTAKGITKAMYTMFSIYGTPDTWDEPMEIMIEQKEIGKNRTFKIKVCS